ncbi:hypothetical protein [Streptomyces sp. NPDC005301]|uniref:hypothetical protein n=1 Tax=Streptomyces sp. NPDC005301 TaxID=3156874 RepID=UPI0033A359B4
MSGGKMSGRVKVLCLVVVLVVLGAGVALWSTRSDGDAEALRAPAEPCWNGIPRRATLQKLLGPGTELTSDTDKFRFVKEHWPSSCRYEALSDEDGRAPVLNVSATWQRDLPPVEEISTIDGRRGDTRAPLDMGAHAFYVRASQAVYFECDVDLPAGAPAYVKRDRYVGVYIYARPMKGTGLSAVEARKVGLDIMLQLAHDLADRAGCENDTGLPDAVPAIGKANWPGYDG